MSFCLVLELGLLCGSSVWDGLIKHIHDDDDYE